jgi:hypothetical protein
MYWKLTLDPSHTYAVEQGAIASRYAQDFTDTADGMSGTFRCPATGLVMLEPSFQKRDFGSDFKGLGNFRRNEADAIFWRNLAKSIDSVAMFSNVKPVGQDRFFIPLATAIKLTTFAAADASADNLDWAFESLFSLGVDEAFAIHYRGLTDELLRKNNWMYIQWDNIAIHISHAGHVRVCWYPDRGDLEGDTIVTHEFDISQPGDLLGKNGMFVFLPIPRHGLVMYHLLSAANFGTTATNTRNYTRKSAHVIPWTERVIGDYSRLFEPSVVRLALNPFHANVIGYQSVTFETSGTYLEQVFDPHYRPSLSPDDIAAQYLDNFGGRFGTVSANLRNKDNSGNWTAGTDRQGRIRFDLATSDTRYTPFVYGWGVQWFPVFQTRAPGAVEITDGYEDVLQRLEFTEDSEGHFSGSCRLKVQTKAAATVVERGRGTFQIEYSDDGEDWTIYYGGIIKFGKPSMQYHPDWGFFWQVEAALHGQEERFNELPNTLGTAFDSLTIGECFNLVMRTAGFSAIPEDDMPAALTNIRVQALQQGTNFRFHPRPGDKYKQVLRLLLFLARTQNNEYKMRYDWEEEVWTVTRRSHGEDEDDTWTLTYDQELEDLENNVAFCAAPLEIEYQPVEATSFTVVGVAERSDIKEGTAVVYESTPITNDSAKFDAEIAGEPNYDFTGMEIGVRILAPGVASVDEANSIARKINPRFFHRNVMAVVMIAPGHFNRHALETFLPDTKVILTLPPYVETPGDRTYTQWVKIRTVIVEGDDAGPIDGMANERAIFHMDAIWENPIKAEA